jgi:hypothetical protein
MFGLAENNFQPLSCLLIVEMQTMILWLLAGSDAALAGEYMHNRSKKLFICSDSHRHFTFLVLPLVGVSHCI